MKTIGAGLFFFFVVSVCAPAQKQELKFNSYTWFEGLELAQSQNKFFLMYISNKNCDYCRDLQKNTFTDSTLVAFLNEKFVVASHKMSSNYGLALVMDFKIASIPVILIQNPKSDDLPMAIYGAKDAATLKKELEEYLDSWEK